MSDAIYAIERKFSDETYFYIVEIFTTLKAAREDLPGWRIGDRDQFDGKSKFRIAKFERAGEVMTEKPKFKVGQVVRINSTWYKRTRKAQQYQRITRIFPWKPEAKRNVSGNVFPSESRGYGYIFLNGDQCHEKYILGLTPKEK